MSNNQRTPSLSNKELIDKIVAYANKKWDPKQGGIDQFLQFIRLYFMHSSLEELEARSITDLYMAVLSHWQLMNQRTAGELKIKVFNPHYVEEGWQSPHTIVEVVSDDMPFLVDSMRMAVDQTIYLMIHMGGMRVVRDKDGNVKEILAFAEQREQALLEAPIYMEIDRQTDPKVLEQIQNKLTKVLNDVRSAVADWQLMRQKVKNIIAHYVQSNFLTEEKKEMIAFLEWILEDHFTFLGYCEYKNLVLNPKSCLGILKQNTQDQVFETNVSPELGSVIISKSNFRSTVHRNAYTDYISFREFNEQGELVSEYCFIGLFTSSAYIVSPKIIPIIRKKVEAIIHKSGLPPRSHAGKDLLHILAFLPRDILFQANVEQLYELAMDILYLQERRRIRLFIYEDTFKRFIYCLVFVPRENFNSDLVREMQDILQNELGGLEVGFSTQFSSSILVRIDYTVRVDPTQRRAYQLKPLEQKLIIIGQSWQDGFRISALEHFGQERGPLIINHYIHAFPAGYRETFTPRNAIFDIEELEKLATDKSLGMSFYRPLGASKDVIRFKLYRSKFTVSLSDALPMLENMGLRVESEQAYSITRKDGSQFWINDFGMTYLREPEFEVEQVKGIFQQAFNKTWLGLAENDSFNRLVLEAQLGWREISVLRGYARYLRQIGFNLSQAYIAQALVNNPAIAKLLIELFQTRFNLKSIENRAGLCLQIEEDIYKQLDKVSSLDDDRILRRYLHVINATMRTNYFQVDAMGHFKNSLSFKLNPQKIPEMPLPIPMFEIFVYSPRVEGVHLRAATVARGGIRWSDRREDFRTEVLGLMKAQRVKNAVIVPGGAKGGFFPKNLPVDGSREEILEEAIACYREFIYALLDLTDNLQNNNVVAPLDTTCYDEADTYLVVAADKGTATFSDIANSIALEKGYWLGDAFASGGSIGYDHKKMGITARGSWVSAKRQFQELGIDIDENPISVVGIGDMSGDVFGNGMLLSPHLKLVGAFNHQHIFLDPDPKDLQANFEERLRLFNLPRSSWADYKRELISAGGGIYSRALKSISLTGPIQKLLDTDKDAMIPSDLIRALLKAPVDMIWNGGIGTYVKASGESNHDVGDHSNDALRINADQLRARVVCEGGNLGFTQLARIEYELNEGKINTDFVDNSGGVDCSDHEVNIKILLNQAVALHKIDMGYRNKLLAEMTQEVAELVLQNNYQQNRAISWLSALSKKHSGLFISHITALEQAGKLDRELEFLPSNKELKQRKLSGQGITKPEMSILLAYSKINLKEQILDSDLPEDPYLSQRVKEPFPTPLRKEFHEELNTHRLRREIIATQLCNRLIADMGVTFVFQMQDETGATVPMIVRAYTAARSIFHMSEFYTDIESLDYKINAFVQYEINEEIVTLVRRASRWLLRQFQEHLDIHEIITGFADPIVHLFRRLPKYILGEDKASLETRQETLIAANVPHDIALRIACIEPIYHALNIVEVATKKMIDIKHVAQVYFILIDRLRLIWFRRQINAYEGGDSYWVFLAKSSYKADLDVLERQLTAEVLRHIHPETENVEEQVDAWLDRRRHLVERWRNILTDLRSIGVKEFAVISVAIRVLANLAQIGSMNQ